MVISGNEKGLSVSADDKNSTLVVEAERIMKLCITTCAIQRVRPQDGTKAVRAGGY